MKPEEVVQAILNVSEDMTRPVYRGQAEADWELRSGALRRLQDSYGDDFLEDDDELRNLVKRYHNEQLILPMEVLDGSKLSALQRLAVLQHQRAATGLLDFTEYPLVALWFACIDSPEDDGRVFVLDIGNHEVARNGRPMEDPFGEEQRVVYLEPDRSLGARIVAQQSVFVIGNPKIPDRFVKSIVVPRQSKKDLCGYLEGLGLSEMALFGDIPGLAAANTAGTKLRIMEPLSPVQYRNRGNRAYQAGRFEEALAAYESYAIAAPDVAQPYSLKGDALAALGRFEEANGAYTRAIENLARPMISIGGRGIVGSSIAATMSRTLYYNRGNVRAASGDHNGAVADYDAALRQGMEPKTYVLFNRGTSKFALGMFQEAHDDFEAVWLERENSGAALGMGNCKVMVGEFEEALDRYANGSAIEADASGIHCQKNAEQIQRLLTRLKGIDFRVRRIGGSVLVETEDLAGNFPLAGNKGNTGNIPSGMVGAAGGEGYEGSPGFGVAIVSTKA